MSEADNHTSGVIGVATGLSIVVNVVTYFTKPEAQIVTVAASGLFLSFGMLAASVTRAEKLKLKPFFMGCAVGGMVGTVFNVVDPIWEDDISELSGNTFEVLQSDASDFADHFILN